MDKLGVGLGFTLTEDRITEKLTSDGFCFKLIRGSSESEFCVIKFSLVSDFEWEGDEGFKYWSKFPSSSGQMHVFELGEFWAIFFESLEVFPLIR